MANLRSAQMRKVRMQTTEGCRCICGYKWDEVNRDSCRSYPCSVTMNGEGWPSIINAGNELRNSKNRPS